ncbi:TPA: nucleoside recognition protein, partial [Candidatus Galligastranaerophilus intestinigallinarum]|nr:nucleoside recognition protein [Candidatus Galligastranaerophilus intestinigallinarum]
MNYIFVFLILISIITAIYTGKIEEVTNELLNASQRAVQVSIGLIGIMAFWLGIAKIAQKSGLINLISKLISPILKLIFNELPKNSPAFSNIALNITANALGLSNAATPFGIKAMKDIKK